MIFYKNGFVNGFNKIYLEVKNYCYSNNIKLSIQGKK